MDRSVTQRYTFFSGAFAVLVACFMLSSRCTDYSAVLPMGAIPSPEDNPITAEKVALGRKLFFDRRLSIDNSTACVDCHFPDRAFTDGRPRGRGVNGGITERNSPTLLNSAYLQTLMFDGEIKTLEMQAIVPIQEHLEMGSNMLELIEELKAVPEYEEAAQRIFGRSFDPFVLTRSIAAFERTLISQNSPFDQYMAGDSSAMNASQRRGWKLFSNELYCTKCHPAPHFTTYAAESNGLYADYGKDQGRYRIDHLETSKGKFKIPTLRNITLTAPYMHDGSIWTLDEVLDHYTKGANNHPNQSKTIVPFQLSARQRKDLQHFFEALTDTGYLSNFQ